jgi:hypothetical protein
MAVSLEGCRSLTSGRLLFYRNAGAACQEVPLSRLPGQTERSSQYEPIL